MHVSQKQLSRKCDRRRTKWSLCAAMLRRRHKNLDAVTLKCCRTSLGCKHNYWRILLFWRQNCEKLIQTKMQSDLDHQFTTNARSQNLWIHVFSKLIVADTALYKRLYLIYMWKSETTMLPHPLDFPSLTTTRVFRDYKGNHIEHLLYNWQDMPI